jgi:coatomer subunit gamma
MAAFSKKEEEGLSSYYNNKTTVIQEARVFNESPISPRKCRALLTRIVYLLYIGENFGTQEATTLFFGTTKLFQHKDVRDWLRHFRPPHYVYNTFTRVPCAR